MTATVGRRRRPAAGSLVYRPAGVDDLAACSHVWHAGLSDYQRRLNQPDLPTDLGPLERFLAHLLATDPASFWVACRGAATDGIGGEVVGFGSATVRGPLWFLAMLFVHPSEQAAGVGTSLLDRTFPGSRLPRPGDDATSGAAPLPAILGTATDSAQPISNALYARFGIVPRMPVFHLVGRPAEGGGIPALPAGIRPVPFGAIAEPGEPGPGHRELATSVGSIDQTLLGFEHPEDHRYLRADGRDGWLYRGPDGSAVGYGYASPVGRIGPVAVLDPRLLAPVVGHLLGAVTPRGASSLWIPGAADETFTALLRSGLRLEGFPALLCWTRPFADLERYVPISLALI